MERYIIHGGRRLEGDLTVQGSKNAVLPIIAATILNAGESVIHNCPKLRDVNVAVEILRSIGCKAKWEGNTLIINTENVNSTVIPDDLATEMRSSVIFIGPMIARCREICISYPGGCEIGPRPIDLHLKALKKMGAYISEEKRNCICCSAGILKSADIHLDYPSVGATENIMIAAVYAQGTTYIRNAAREPEIIDLQEFLRKIGVRINGAGTGTIRVTGNLRKTKNVEHTVIPDRIAAGTYMGASAITGGDITFKNVIPLHISSIISNFVDCGCSVTIKNDTVRVKGPKKLKSVDCIRTLPYPGFPTDMQAPLTAMLSIADGSSLVIETVFENRFRHVSQLVKMGADISCSGRTAVIRGVEKLKGSNVTSQDLRGGAALVLAGLVAEGYTVIDGISHIERGYEDMVNILGKMGGNIRKER